MDPFGDLEVLRGELKAYNGERTELVVATKCDLLHKDSLLNLDSLFFKIRSQIGEEIPVVGTSARFGLGINRLVHQIRQQLFPNQILHTRPRVPAEVVDNSQFHKLR
jgi:GTPase involved in cell partitioning and DNA repair